MGRGLNKVMIIGHVGREPEMPRVSYVGSGLLSQAARSAGRAILPMANPLDRAFGPRFLPSPGRHGSAALKPTQFSHL